MPDISIVTLVNKEKVFNNCLKKSLDKQINIDVELIKIDNTNNQYTSLAKAYSEHLDKIHSNWTMFVHPDIIFEENIVLKKLLDDAKKSNLKDSDIALWGVAGKNNKNEIITDICDNVTCYKHKYNSFDHNKTFIYVSVLDACCWLVRTDFIKEIGFMKASDGFHMVVEEVCMHVNSIDKKIAVLSSDIWHYSPSNAYNYTYWREGIKVIKKYKLDYFITTSNFYKNPFLLIKMYASMIGCYFVHDLLYEKIGKKLNLKNDKNSEEIYE